LWLATPFSAHSPTIDRYRLLGCEKWLGYDHYSAWAC
jgi:hypothetical protein